MKYLHTMVRVSNLEQSLDFYCNKLGLIEVKRTENAKGRFTLVFLAAPADIEQVQTSYGPMLELTYNWDPEDYTEEEILAIWHIMWMISIKSANIYRNVVL